MINEYVQGTPMYQQPVYPQYPQQPMMMQGQYQGNVGTDPFVQQTPNTVPQNFQGFVPPMGNVPFGF